MALAVPVDPALQHLLRADRDELNPQARTGSAAQRLRQRDDHRDGGQVVVRAGHGRAALDVGHRRRGAGADHRSRTRPAPSAAEAAGRGQQRPGQHGPPHRQRGVEPLDDAGEAIDQPLLEGRVEDEAGLGRVVVGEDDQRPLGVGIAGLGDDVPGRPLGPDQLAERAARRSRCRRRSGPDHGSGDRARPGGRAGVVAATAAAAPAAARAPTTRRNPPGTSPPRPAPGAPAAVSRSAIQCAACRSPSDPAGALDRRQGLDHLAQGALGRAGSGRGQFRVRGHGAERLRWSAPFRHGLQSAAPARRPRSARG